MDDRDPLRNHAAMELEAMLRRAHFEGLSVDPRYRASLQALIDDIGLPSDTSKRLTLVANYDRCSVPKGTLAWLSPKTP